MESIKMTPKRILALAARVKKVKSYSADDLNAVLVRQGGSKWKPAQRVFLVDDETRDVIVEALRHFATHKEDRLFGRHGEPAHVSSHGGGDDL